MSHSSLVEIYIATKTASSMGAPPAEIRAEAEQAVSEATAKIEAMRKAGDFKSLNTKYKTYRLAMIERGQRALPYSVFLERRVAKIVQQIAATGG